MLRLFLNVTSCLGVMILVANADAVDVPAKSFVPKLSWQELGRLRIPDVEIKSTAHFKAGENNARVDHVQVLGVIGGRIGFELLLPDQWNERFVMGGGGLFVGSIQNQARFSLDKGYATAGTDAGHSSDTVFDAEWAYLDPEAQVDFGYRSVHRTAEVSKYLISRCYARDVRFSYFLGCSTGGRQGLMEATRFPDDFDGIVSGCSVASKTGLYAAFINHVQTFSKSSQPLLTQQEMQEFANQVLQQCDGKDGLVDGIINHPIACELDWSQVTGLNEKQVEALKSAYRGPVINGQSLYPGLPLGSEIEWYRWFVGPDPDMRAGSSFSSLGRACTEFGRYLVFDDPKWSAASYHLANWTRDSRRAAAVLNCDSGDLEAFRRSNGKLIIWHSWSDGALTANASIEYFHKISSPAKSEIVRLYLLPGVIHCGGGPGPSEVDWIDVVSRWVEGNQAPARLVAQKRDQDGTVVLSRPMYPFPRHIRYKGNGDPGNADSFEPVEP